MGKSDLLKDGMKSGLDGLLSSTKKSPQKKETVPAKAEKELGWKAERNLEDMCRDSWHFMMKNR